MKMTESKEKAEFNANELDMIIKSNKNKLPDKSGLKIPFVENMPNIEIKKNKVKPTDSVANLKRLQSLKERKKGYAAQKSLISNALSYGGNKVNNKITFDDEEYLESPGSKVNGSKTNGLFDGNSDDDSEFEGNFNVKEQFQGESGQKLLELQSRYKNDSRFALDERFIESGKEKSKILEEDNLEAEKNEQLKILEQVIGKKVTSLTSTNKKENATKKMMLKFDPSQPEHSTFELTVEEPERKKKKKEKMKSKDLQISGKPEPDVSKEVFYKVPEKLTETLATKSNFSLLSMFGKVTENEDLEQGHGLEKQKTTHPIETNKLKSSGLGNQNPFKYDSSDDENEIDDIPHRDTSTKTLKNDTTQNRPQSVFWTEPFFFKTDDFRLQEGLDFIEKIKTQNKEFLKVRRELKGIVKAKVRNNERKNKMFKKKLGGSKRRKHIRIKKALKR